ncbi:MAG: AAA family ATPase, partial [Myxococcales bacterium]|nr:AAA family ATPase [Myxococcales bacterium]
MTDARETLTTLIALWERERRAARERFAAERAELSVAERVARGTLLVDLAIDEAEPTAGGRLRLWLGRRDGAAIDRQGLRLGTGDPARLHFKDPGDDDALSCVVGRFARGRVAVVVDSDVPDRYESGGFRLAAEAPEVTFDRGAAALRATLDAPRESDLGVLRETIYGRRPVSRRDRRVERFFDPDLNAAQEDAVRHALTAEPVALVHGPPGTGKTRTLVEVVRQHVALGERVLVTAASHVAVDNLVERLAATEVSVVRLGHPARVMPSVEALTLDALVDASEAAALAKRWGAEARDIRKRVYAQSERGTLRGREKWEQLQEARRLEDDARHHLRRSAQAILARHQVIATTAAGATSHALQGAGELDCVVLDEATQAPDPMALVALANARRAVLAGDPCQLPPTVIDREAERGGLGTTIFDRLMARGDDDVLRLLTVQHRMHAALMAFPSAMLYGGRLVAAPHVAAHRLEELAGVAADLLRPGPLAVVDTAGKGFAEALVGDDKSTSNPDQADRVAAEVRRLLGRGLAASDCAVITPYDAQARALRERLAAELARGLEIGTVDGFQGR